MTQALGTGLSRFVMTTVLGLLGLVAFIACVIILAAGVTWSVVKAPRPTSEERRQKSAT